MLCWVNPNELETCGLKENIDTKIERFHDKRIRIYANIYL